MRINLVPILIQTETLLSAIEDKSQSRASHAAHVLLYTLPDPTWAETAPGMRIYYGIEHEASKHIEELRYWTCKWMAWLIEKEEEGIEWPAPNGLRQTISLLSALDANVAHGASLSAESIPMLLPCTPGKPEQKADP